MFGACDEVSTMPSGLWRQALTSPHPLLRGSVLLSWTRRSRPRWRILAGRQPFRRSPSRMLEGRCTSGRCICDGRLAGARLAPERRKGRRATRSGWPRRAGAAHPIVHLRNFSTWTSRKSQDCRRQPEGPEAATHILDVTGRSFWFLALRCCGGASRTRHANPATSTARRCQAEPVGALPHAAGRRPSPQTHGTATEAKYDQPRASHRRRCRPSLCR